MPSHKLCWTLFFLLGALSSATGPFVQGQPSAVRAEAPVRVAVAGFSHGHVGWILGREDRGDIEVVGYWEADRALAARMQARYGLDPARVFVDLDAMLEATRPEAVVVFTSIYDHLAVVRAAAARGIHVMVEKPLAVSREHARAMAEAARAAGIHLLTNYETTWYGSVHEARRLIEDGAIGTLRKLIVYDGHQGPQEIGVGEEFLAWLTDPTLNGGGVLTDFGCYGANLITWLMDGRRPLSVTAVTQQFKPDRYPKVDDEATIVLTYPDAQGIIQASWNWPYSRKDMHLYGTEGALFQDDPTRMRVRRRGEAAPTALEAVPRPSPFDDPFAYLAAVVRGRVDPAGSLSSLENNLIVVDILDAARRSAQTGTTVRLGEP
ncbi:oxidoreductase [Rhodothermaceae bacterium RA]|nr:oxidoreductase [Rhodothermaceae bacterium RA]